MQGPELMTCGPYRPISLITFNARIESVNTRAHISAAPALSPSLKVDITVGGDVSAVKGAKVVLKSLDGTVVREEKVQQVGENAVSWDLKDRVQLWWPVGYGSQNLYHVEISLLGDVRPQIGHGLAETCTDPRSQSDAVLDTLTRRIGFRSVELIQEPLEEADRYGKGTTFLFEVNGVRMFMGGASPSLLSHTLLGGLIYCLGSNWIPAHNFLTQLTADSYRAWLTLLRDGNQNMVRLWGGGVYEPDVFYDICDGACRLGRGRLR